MLLCPSGLALENAETRDRTGGLQIFSLTLSQLSYRGTGTLVCRKPPPTRRKSYPVMHRNLVVRTGSLRRTAGRSCQKPGGITRPGCLTRPGYRPDSPTVQHIVDRNAGRWQAMGRNESFRPGHLLHIPTLLIACLQYPNLVEKAVVLSSQGGLPHRFHI